MLKNKLSDSELLILGLIAEMPRHGYELERVIEKRSMREWTQIGFSSIYYTLGKLEGKGLIQAGDQSSPRSRKSYSLTERGKDILVEQTIYALEAIQPTFPSLLLGMLHLDSLARGQALDALRIRAASVSKEINRIEEIHFHQQPLPDHVDLVFEYSLAQLKSEAAWIGKALAYLETKTWLE